jgi:hypothetical protein
MVGQVSSKVNWLLSGDVPVTSYFRVHVEIAGAKGVGSEGQPGFDNIITADVALLITIEFASKIVNVFLRFTACSEVA